jgi:biopolymer transport protein ExbD
VARSAGFIKFAAAHQGGEKAAKVIVFGDDEQPKSWLSFLKTGYIGVIVNSLTVDGWVVIGLLAVMALISWCVMIGKALYLGRVGKGNEQFLHAWRRVATDLSVLDDGDGSKAKSLGGTDAAAQRAMHGSPLFRVYHIGVEEIRHRLAADRSSKVLSARSIQAIRAALDGGLVRETHRLSGQMVLLTIAISGGPFLGAARHGRRRDDHVCRGGAGGRRERQRHRARHRRRARCHGRGSRCRDPVALRLQLSAHAHQGCAVGHARVHRRIRREDGGVLLRDRRRQPHDHQGTVLAERAADAGQKVTMQAPTEEKPYDDINITPMLDLAYVLLVIFILMCTASVQGVKVNLPKASAAPSLAKPKTRAVTVNNEGKIFLDTVPVTLAELEQRLAEYKQATPDLPVVVKGDSQTQYQGIMDVLDVFGRLGITQVGLATKTRQ